MAKREGEKREFADRLKEIKKLKCTIVFSLLFIFEVLEIALHCRITTLV